MEPGKTEEENTNPQNEISPQNLQEQNTQTVEKIQSDQINKKPKKINWWIVVLAILGSCAIGAIICFILLNRPIELNYQSTETNYKESYTVLESSYDFKVEQIITTYDEYQSLLENVYAQIKADEYSRDYYINEGYGEYQVNKDDFADNDFVAFTFRDTSCDEGFKGIRSINNTYNQVKIEVGYVGAYSSCEHHSLLILVPIGKNKVSSNAEIIITEKKEDHYDYDEYEDLKPIIYLYPEQTTEISVKLGNPEKISASYPEYNNGWQVIAEPNGDLTEVGSGKKLYSLYWEGKDSTLKATDEGFVIPGSQTAEFLDEKLKILGLNDYEREEFIIYWLPKMQDNNFNYIRFATEAEIEENMPLEVTPKPDTVVRVMMVTEPLENYKEVKEQTLTPKARSGYTVVEWGGSVDGNVK